MNKTVLYKHPDEALGNKIAGTQLPPDFVIAAKVDDVALANIEFRTIIQNLINTNLALSNYLTEDKIRSLFFTYMIHSPNIGIQRNDSKYYLRRFKFLYIDIRFPDYEKFCTATKDEALSMMAQQTIRAADKYLSKEKFFKYDEFKNDLVDVFKRNGII